MLNLNSYYIRILAQCTEGNRSPVEVNYVAGRMRCTQSAGDDIKDGIGWPCSAASHAVVREVRTCRCCGVGVATIVIMASPKRELSAL